MKRSLLVITSILLILVVVLSFGISGCTKTEESSPTAAAPTTTAPKPTTTTPTTATTKPAPTLSSIAVTPASPVSLTVGSNQRFTATGTYTDGSSRELFSATWTSDNPSVVNIDSTGLARGMAEGQANITASQSGITSSPVSITVAPAPPPPETTPAATTTTPATTTPAATTPSEGATVYVSVSVESQLLVAAQPVAYIEGMTLEDVIKAAHEAYYTGGESGYDIGTNNAFGMYMVNKCWGVAQVPFIILNDHPNSEKVFEAVNTVKVAANDNIIICTAAAQGAATPVSLTATISGDSVTLTATSWTMSMATYTYSHAPLANANVIDPITGASLGTTDADGHITVTIPASGIVAIEGLAAINVNASAT